MSDPGSAPPPPPRQPQRRPPQSDGQLPPLVYALIACLFVTLVILLVTAHHVRRMRRRRRTRQQQQDEEAAAAAAEGIAVLQLKHVWIPPIVVNPDASMALGLANGSGAWQLDAADLGGAKQQGAGCAGSGDAGDVCTWGASHSGITVVVRGHETAFSHVSLPPATRVG